MPRISREMIKVREAFSVDKFRAGMDIEACQNALMAEYGNKMNPYRLKALYDSVKNESAINPDPTVPSVADVVTAPTHNHISPESQKMIDTLDKEIESDVDTVNNNQFNAMAEKYEAIKKERDAAVEAYKNSGFLPTYTIDTLRKEVDALRQDNDELRLKETYVSEWKAEVKELEKKIDKLTKQLEEREETISRLEDEESTAQTKLDDALVESFNNEKYSNLVQHMCDARNMPMARVTEYLDREDYINAARLLTQ